MRSPGTILPPRRQAGRATGAGPQPPRAGARAERGRDPDRPDRRALGGGRRHGRARPRRPRGRPRDRRLRADAARAAAGGRCCRRPSTPPMPRCAAAPARERLGEIGATVVALLIEGGARHGRPGPATAAPTGCGAGALERLTRDHSLVQELIDRGELDRDRGRAATRRRTWSPARSAPASGSAPAFAELELAAGRGAAALLRRADPLRARGGDRRGARRAPPIRPPPPGRWSRRRWRRGRRTTSRRW